MARVKSILGGIWRFILGLPIWLGLVQNPDKKKVLRDFIENPEARQQLFLDEQWLANVMKLDRRANAYKSMYYILRFIAVIGAVLLPFYAAGGRNPETASLLSVIVAASVGWEAAFRYGEKWQLFRRMAVELEGAGVQFLQKFRPGQGAVPEKDFTPFVQRVQQIIKRNVEYGDVVEDSVAEAPASQSAAPRNLKAAPEAVADEPAPEPAPAPNRPRPAPKPRKQS